MYDKILNAITDVIILGMVMLMVAINFGLLPETALSSGEHIAIGIGLLIYLRMNKD